MKKSQNASASTDNDSLVHEDTVERETGDTTKDTCRCKEVSKKTPMELLKLMIKDLAIWKK